MSIHYLPKAQAWILNDQALTAIAIFRTLDDFRSDYDPKHLSRLARKLALHVDPALAE